MIPKKYDAHEYDYPDYQPDQVLSADHLNHSFSFNEQQQRLTRTNVLGIGIVCGLKATRSADGKTVTITKGTGITSQGYLIVHGKENSEEAIEYKKYSSFNALQDIKYDRFVSGITAKYPIWELLDADNAKPTDSELSTAFLNNKVCLLFYEMLEVDAKNCDTTSCDDKGITITVNIRKLLVNATDADKIIAECNAAAKTSGSGETFPGLYSLAELRLPKFDVPATGLETSNDIYEAYKNVFSKKFVEDTGKALNAAFNMFKQYIKESSNPFSNFNSDYAFLHNGGIYGNHLLNYQYFYGFFGDLLQAYNEWRYAATQMVAMCTPPEALFPRHLFLCSFSESEGVEKSKYRNYFIPSPIHADHANAYNEFKALFLRLSRMVSSQYVPFPQVTGTATNDSKIRVTPSVLGKSALGEKSIPFYYNPTATNNRLLDVWNYKLSRRGQEKLNLSYNGITYGEEDFVKAPLEYDHEPYNFFRIEGHIGKKMPDVLYNLEVIRSKHRLPIHYVALSVDGEDGFIDLDDVKCCFEDLYSMYEVLADGLACQLYKLLLCLYRQPRYVRTERAMTGAPTAAKPATATTGTMEFAPKYSYGYRTYEKIAYTDNSLGQAYEELQPMLKSNTNYLSVVKSYADLLKNADSTATKEELDSSSTLLTLVHTITVLHNSLNSSLAGIDGLTILDNTTNLKKSLSEIRSSSSLKLLSELFAQNPCLSDLYDVICKLTELLALIAEYTTRLQELKNEATLQAFIKKNPGIEHKGGVTKGGTFILVYRNAGDPASGKGIEFLSRLKAADKEAIAKDTAKESAVKFSANQLNYEAVNFKGSTAELGEVQKQILTLQKRNWSKAAIEIELGLQLRRVKSKGIFTDETEKLANGIVVADFYLPYVCGSYCRPIQFVVNVPPPKVVLALAEPAYCSADKGEHAIIANPTGGDLTASQPDAIKELEDGTFIFLPGKVTIPAGSKNVTINLSYTYEGQMQSASVRVDRTPAVKVVANTDETNPLAIAFTFDKPEMIDSAIWDFGDGGASGELAPSHTFEVAGKYSVTAVVKNGTCTVTTEPLVVTVKEPQPVILKGLPEEICSSAKDVTFAATPPGGTITGEGVNDISAGKYLFSPGSVGMTAPKKTVTIIYTAPAGNSATANVTVYAQPEGDKNFDIGEGDKPNSARFFFTGLRNVAAIDIDYGDGTKETLPVNFAASFRTDVHTFTGTGPYTVNATLINGTCKMNLTPVKTSFTIRTDFKKECQLLSVPVGTFVKQKMTSLMTGNAAFVESYTKIRITEVVGFFTALQDQIKLSPIVPVSFFAQHPLKMDWIISLPVSGRTTRALSLQLLALFTDITTTISCLKGEDISQGAIITQPLFDAILRKLTELQKIQTADASSINSITSDVGDELKKVEANKEASIKKGFVTMLNRINTLIKSLS